MAFQIVTPELRRWIVEQAQAGFVAESVLQSMLKSGWEEDTAIAAMEATMLEHMNSQQLAPQADQASLKTPLPEPMPDGLVNVVPVDGCEVKVITSMREPRILVFSNLLSDAECEELIESARTRLSRSMTVAVDDGSEKLHEDRTSNGMFFERGETALIKRLETRFARLLNWPEENGEGLQVLQYLPGAEYKPHHDYFEPAEAGTPALLKRGGQRVGTLIIYLNEPVRGGSTVFPAVNLEVVPRRGHAVFFSYGRPDPSTRSLHGGTPVLEGEKWIATKWLREHEFV